LAGRPGTRAERLSEAANAAYIPWRFVSGEVGQSKAWLRDLIGRLMRAETLDQPEPDLPANPPWRPTALKALKMLRDRDDVWVVNVALTKTGLTKLGVGAEELSRFSAEFLEGMAPEKPKPDAPMPRRCNILGDIENNSPQNWQWGGWDANGEPNGKIDGMLLLYADSAGSLDRLI
jgi:hypothetical protein